jgi:histidine triad (HIT) family protein
MSDCIFCKIVQKQIPADVVFENDHVVAFRDLHPTAPTHVLVIPKKHIIGMHEVTRDEVGTLGEVFVAARDVAEKLGLHATGYRIVANNGKDAGQSVFHLHVHVIGGKRLGWPPFPAP